MSRAQLLERLYQQLEFARLLLVGSEQRFGLDIQQMRGHLDKFAGDLEVHALHPRKIVQILLEDIGDLQIADLDFVFGKEHQDQAERTFKVLQLIFLSDDALEVITWILHLFQRNRRPDSANPHWAKIRSLPARKEIAVRSGAPSRLVKTSA